MKFWNRTHEMYDDYEKLYDELVPDSGWSSTRAGEILRAASRINYDHYNNGSCNNTTGAWRYLELRGRAMLYSLNMGDEFAARFNEALATVWLYMNCNAPEVSYEDATLNDAMDTLVEIATRIAWLDGIAGPENRVPNTADLFDLQEPNVYDDPYEDSWL